MSFVDDIATGYGVPTDNLLVAYLNRKTRAVDRGSKARRSLGNLYALYVLAEDYAEGTTSRFTDLLARMKAMPFGSKLQNHPLDNRLNDEFSRQMGVSGDLLPVRATVVDGQKARVISVDLLSHKGADPQAVAALVLDTVNEYIRSIDANQTSALDEIDQLSTIEELGLFFEASFAPASDARLFEIASYVLLAEHYKSKLFYIGQTIESVVGVNMVLYKTGRTNANDGGIDFVLQPVGRFFQVSETLDFKKYFLDFEKVNRYPLSFVIKTDAPAEDVIARIEREALRSRLYTEEQVAIYMALIEEVFTLPNLKEIAASLRVSDLERIKSELALQFKLEYGLLD